MQFAGHPTIGTAIALADRLVGAAPRRLRFGSASATLPIAIDRGAPTTAWLTTPPVRSDARSLVRMPPRSWVWDCRRTGRPAADARRRANPFLYVRWRAKRPSIAPCSTFRRCAQQRMERHQRRLPFRPDRRRRVRPHVRADVGHRRGSGDRQRHGTAVRVSCSVRRAPGKERFVTEQGVAMGRPSVLHVRIAVERRRARGDRSRRHRGFRRRRTLARSRDE